MQNISIPPAVEAAVRDNAQLMPSGVVGARSRFAVTEWLHQAAIQNADDRSQVSPKKPDEMARILLASAARLESCDDEMAVRLCTALGLTCVEFVNFANYGEAKALDDQKLNILSEELWNKCMQEKDAQIMELEARVVALETMDSFPISLGAEASQQLCERGRALWHGEKIGESPEALVKLINWACEKEEKAKHAGFSLRIPDDEYGQLTKTARKAWEQAKPKSPMELVQFLNGIYNLIDKMRKEEVRHSDIVRKLGDEIVQLKERGGFDTTGLRATNAQLLESLAQSRAENDHLRKEESARNAELVKVNERLQAELEAVKAASADAQLVPIRAAFDAGAEGKLERLLKALTAADALRAAGMNELADTATQKAIADIRR